MRGEAPENIFLSPYLPDVQAVGIQIVDLSECALLNQRLQLQDRRVIPENVADHENPAPRGGRSKGFLPCSPTTARRLLDDHVFLASKTPFDHSEGVNRRRRRGDAGNRGFRENGAE